MALITSAEPARVIFSFRDKQPDAGETFGMSSVIGANTVTSQRWSQRKSRGIGLRSVQST